jgi:hypothetical protein
MKRLFIILLLVGAVAPTKVTAAGLSSEKVQKLCKDDSFYCTMFLLGIERGINMGIVATISGELTRDNDKGAKLTNKVLSRMRGCWPEEGLSTRQRRKIWMKYLENNPRTLHLPANITYLYAMREAFPCK